MVIGLGVSILVVVRLRVVVLALVLVVVVIRFVVPEGFTTGVPVELLFLVHGLRSLSHISALIAHRLFEVSQVARSHLINQAHILC